MGGDMGLLEMEPSQFVSFSFVSFVYL